MTTATPRAAEGPDPGFVEFVAMMAALIAMVALSIDAILPALAAIGEDLGAGVANDRQLAVSVFFIGLACAQIVYGPLSDSFGRRGSIFLGLGIYLAGTALCLVAETLPALLFGRVIQGIGAAGPRIVANAIVRDRFNGREMARVLSLVMMVFIVVPVFAPLLGQLVLFVAPWQGIFWGFGVIAVAALLWAIARLPETHPPERRSPFRAGPIFLALREVFTNRVAMGTTLAMGCVFSSFLAFLSASQQVLGEAYGLGALFPVTFSALAVIVGVSSAVNANLVMRFGMVRLSSIGIAAVGVASVGYALWFWAMDAQPPLWGAILWLAVSVGAIGIVFSNLNAMAMEPLGHIAGVAAGAVASIASLMSALLGGLIARSYDGSALPIALGFIACSVAAFLLLHWANAARPATGATA